MIVLAIGLVFMLFGFIYARRAGERETEAQRQAVRLERAQEREQERRERRAEEEAKIAAAEQQRASVNEELLWQAKKRETDIHDAWLEEEIYCRNQLCTIPVKSSRGDFYYLPKADEVLDLNRDFRDKNGRVSVCAACYRETVGKSVIDDQAVRVRDFNLMAITPRHPSNT